MPAVRDPLSQTFAALADPTRRGLLARLASGPASVNDLAAPYLAEMSLPAVTKHLKVLERAGLVTQTRKAQWRPRHLNVEPLQEAHDWMEAYRQCWEQRLDRLGAFLQSVSPSPTTPEESPTCPPTPRRTS